MSYISVALLSKGIHANGKAHRTVGFLSSSSATILPFVKDFSIYTNIDWCHSHLIQMDLPIFCSFILFHFFSFISLSTSVIGKDKDTHIVYFIKNNGSLKIKWFFCCTFLYNTHYTCVQMVINFFVLSFEHCLFPSPPMTHL